LSRRPCGRERPHTGPPTRIQFEIPGVEFQGWGPGGRRGRFLKPLFLAPRGPHPSAQGRLRRPSGTVHPRVGLLLVAPGPLGAGRFRVGRGVCWSACSPPPFAPRFCALPLPALAWCSMPGLGSSVLKGPFSLGGLRPDLWGTAACALGPPPGRPLTTAWADSRESFAKARLFVGSFLGFPQSLRVAAS